MRRVAVLLNRHARRVVPKLIDWMAAELPAGDLFVTGSADESRAAAREILARDYGALCVGGGDGTFMQAARDLLALAPERLPALLPLRLGTGNAICDVCGSRPATRAGLAADLARAASDEAPVPQRLLSVDGAASHFAGVGLDARYAEDHRALIKERLARGRLAPIFRGGFGFFWAAAARTIPRLFVEPRFRVRVVSAGGPAHRLGPDGEPDGAPLPDGAVLHEGDVIIAAASTVPYYSSGLKFFPFADRWPDRVMLRVSSAGPLRVLASLPGVFNGTYRNPNVLWDFAVTRARFELTAPAPFHLGGDVMPRSAGFEVELSPRAIPLLRGAAH